MGQSRSTRIAETLKKNIFRLQLMEMLGELKVVDFSSVLAGPAVATFFAELGAQVVKIENKLQGGDVTRQWKLTCENADSPVSAYFCSVNYGKEYRFLDINQPNDKQAVVDLAQQADIFITNYRASSLKKMGLNAENLLKINPRLIYASIVGFESEPDRVAYDVVLQAETGYMAMNGTPDTAPVKLPLAFIDILAAHQLKEAILLALYKRAASGRGMRVSVSLEAAAIASLANQAGNWLMAQHNPQPIGSLHPNIAPYGEIFKTEDDKLIVLAVGSDDQFAKLCAVLGKSELAQQPRYGSNPNRVKHRQQLFADLQALFASKKSKLLIEAFVNQHIPAGIVKSIAEVFDSPFAQSMVLSEEIGDISTKRVKSVAFRTE